MGIATQAKNVLPWSDQKLSGNGYIGLMTLMGVVGWSVTAYLLHFQTPPPEGASSFQKPIGWLDQVDQFGWPLMALWTGLFVAVFLITYFRTEDGVRFSLLNVFWSVGMAIALILNAVAVNFDVMVLVWLPWLVLFALGYLLTGVMVSRGGVYIAAGLVSGALAANGVYSYFTNSGLLVVDFYPYAEAPIEGAVLFPMPMTYVVIGLLHVVPMAVDALRGGRQLTEEGIPKAKAEQVGADEEDTDVGGVVTK